MKITKVGQTACFDLAYSEVYGNTAGMLQLIMGVIALIVNIILGAFLLISFVQFFIYDVDITEVIIVELFNIS
jgi:diacylglycerol kinase